MSTTGVVAALSAEARTLGRCKRRSDGLLALADGTLVAVSGMGAAAAAAAARALVDAGVGALVSWGVAGGLDPDLAAGTICLPANVLAHDGSSFGTDLHWREILAAAIAARRRVVNGPLLTHDTVVQDIAGKAAVFNATGAVAVDMESMGVAGIAARSKLPFVVVRVIVDTAYDVLPPAVLAASCDGQVRLVRLIAAVLRAPRDLGPLLRLVRRYRLAIGALRSVARTGALAPIAFGVATPTRIA